MMTKKQLTNIFMEAKRNKLEYYLKTYDSELRHCRNNDVRIINAFAIDFYLGDD